VIAPGTVRLNTVRFNTEYTAQNGHRGIGATPSFSPFRCRSTDIEPPILNRFGKIGRVDARTAGEIGDRARDTQDAVIGAR